MKKEQVFLSLGGNQKNPLVTIKTVLTLLASNDKISQVRFSHFYRTQPIEMVSPHWFVNAACSFWTTLGLAEVFQITQAIERQLGKMPKPKNHDRPIDIDVLFYGTQIHEDDQLKIPHPRWQERLFVLQPLADLTKEIILQDNQGVIHYFLEKMIHSLQTHEQQTISLLEKNPHLQ